jgi:hypothetical protein
MIRAFAKASPLFKFAGTPAFTTDGCSGWMTFLWLKVFGHVPGGKPLDLYRRYRGRTNRTRSRLDADNFLFKYIWRKGYPTWAVLCWVAVRFGGSQYLPFSWRWRYRERYLDVLMGK